METWRLFLTSGHIALVRPSVLSNVRIQIRDDIIFTEDGQPPYLVIHWLGVEVLMTEAGYSIGRVSVDIFVSPS